MRVSVHACVRASRARACVRLCLCLVCVQKVLGGMAAAVDGVVARDVDNKANQTSNFWIPTVARFACAHACARVCTLARARVHPRAGTCACVYACTCGRVGVRKRARVRLSRCAAHGATRRGAACSSSRALRTALWSAEHPRGGAEGDRQAFARHAVPLGQPHPQAQVRHSAQLLSPRCSAAQRAGLVAHGALTMLQRAALQRGAAALQQAARAVALLQAAQHGPRRPALRAQLQASATAAPRPPRRARTRLFA